MTDPSPTEPAPELLTRVATTRATQEQAAAVHDQAIRDAKAAGHHPVTRIAGILGVTNRMRLYGVLEKPPANPPNPRPPRWCSCAAPALCRQSGGTSKLPCTDGVWPPLKTGNRHGTSPAAAFRWWCS